MRRGGDGDADPVPVAMSAMCSKLDVSMKGGMRLPPAALLRVSCCQSRRGDSSASLKL